MCRLMNQSLTLKHLQTINMKLILLHILIRLYLK